MVNLKQAMTLLHPYLNNGERVQSSILGQLEQSPSQSIQTKGILCATNERVCFFTKSEHHSNFTSFDYYKIEAVDLDELNDNEIVIYNDGEKIVMSLIEEGDVIDFNDYVLDRMKIKS